MYKIKRNTQHCDVDHGAECDEERTIAKRVQDELERIEEEEKKSERRKEEAANRATASSKFGPLYSHLQREHKAGEMVDGQLVNQMIDLANELADLGSPPSDDIPASVGASGFLRCIPVGIIYFEGVGFC